MFHLRHSHYFMYPVLSNPTLPTILKEDSRGILWKGNPIDNKGRFLNIEFPFEPEFSQVLKWQLSSNHQKQEKILDIWRPTVHNSLDFLHTTSDCIVWLGHSCFYIRLNGITIITDPVFGAIPFTKRYTPFPFSPDLLKNVNYLFISHDHRDHCHKESIQTIVKNNKGIRLLSGLGMDGIMNNWLKDYTHWSGEYAGWYQQFTSDTSKINMYFLPSRHWSRHGLFDTNKRLWGAFVISTSSCTIYMSGDTGYGSHFKDAGMLFPEPDIAIMGIGAYAPTWFMSPNHITPKDAIRGFHDMNAKTFIPMHYGTFDLSDEPISEPVSILQRMYNNGEINGTLRIPSIAEPIIVS